MIDLTNIPDKPVSVNTTSLKFKQDLINFFKDKNLNTCLEIGTCHGWTTKILSSLFKTVYTVDHRESNTQLAKQNNVDNNNIIYYTADAYNSITYINMPKMDAVFIDCIHTYDAVIYDINTALSLFDSAAGIYLIFDDHGHGHSPADGVRHAILTAINAGLKIETYIGEPAGYSYQPGYELVDYEGIILSYGKN